MTQEFPHRRLYETYAPRLHALARRLCGNEHDAADMVQDTFLQAHRRWSTFRGRADPGTWLYAIAVRRCRRAVIQPRRRRPTPQFSQLAPFADTTVIDRPARGPAPWERAATAEQVRLMESAIAELPVDFRVALVLKDIIELTVEETARVLGVRPATVKTRVHRARLMLRAALMRATPQRPAPEPSYPKQVCIDLLHAKLAAMDRGLGAALPQNVVCERCRAVFDELDLTQNVCASLGKAEIALAIRALKDNSGTSKAERASKRCRRGAKG